MPMSQVTSSHFAKYFCGTYFEYITPCTVMTYATSDVYGSRLHGYALYARKLRSGPIEWIILGIARKRKLANYLSYPEHWINFHIIYYPLYMLILQVYHNSGRLRDFGRMPDSGRISRLRSHFLTPVNIATSDVSPNSCRTSWLWSMSVPPVLPP
jgi:hypothetical protein